MNKKQPWISFLQSTDITEDAVHALYSECLLNFIPIKPLCEIMIDYLTCVVKQGPSYYDMNHSYLSKKIQKNLIVPIKSFGYSETDLRHLLEMDLVSEVEVTQDGNQGGSYYRCFFRVTQSCWLRKDYLLLPTVAHEIVPMGGPNKPWSFQLGGPNIMDMPKQNTIYRLSNGVLFDFLRIDRYQIKFIRRS